MLLLVCIDVEVDWEMYLCRTGHHQLWGLIFGHLGFCSPRQGRDRRTVRWWKFRFKGTQWNTCANIYIYINLLILIIGSRSTEFHSYFIYYIHISMRPSIRLSHSIKQTKIYSTVHKYLDREAIFVLLPPYMTAMDLKRSNWDAIEVWTFSFNSGSLTKILN